MSLNFLNLSSAAAAKPLCGRDAAATLAGMPTILLLPLSNLFMTTAWYSHVEGGQRGRRRW